MLPYVTSWKNLKSPSKISVRRLCTSRSLGLQVPVAWSSYINLFKQWHLHANIMKMWVCLTWVKSLGHPSAESIGMLVNSSCVNFVACQLAYAHLFQLSPQIVTGVRSGPCNIHSKTLTLVSLSYFLTNLDILTVNVCLEEPFVSKV